MIPVGNSLKAVDIAALPSKDYRMELAGKRIAGTCEDREELWQTIYCILNTERYRYPVYSWNYGIELRDLYGKPMDYALSELQRRIAEALTQDDRIESVDGFAFDVSGKAVTVQFTVHTVYGEISEEWGWKNV